MGLLDEDWILRLKGFSQLMVGFSGGLDSTVLLHALASVPALRDKIQAVHIHHGLSPYATRWQQHCALFCTQHHLSFMTHSVVLTAQGNIEEEARKARWGVFSSLLEEDGGLLLAHHQDDQAETLLLQLCRGAGVDGIAGMSALRRVAEGVVLRPFLHIPREHLKAYAAHHALTWIEDESNDDIAFSRNYVRHQVMPLLRERCPSVREALSTCATHCQQAKANLDDLARMDCPDLEDQGHCLALVPLMHLNEARLSNVLRSWLNHQGVRIPSAKTQKRLIQEVIGARQDGAPCVQWGEYKIRRFKQTLYLQKQAASCSLSSMRWSGFPQPLCWGDMHMMASLAETGLHVPEGSEVDVCFREGGESIVWRGRTRELKKLFQQWGVPPWRRERVPLIYIDGQLAAVLDFCVSDLYHGAQNNRVYRIEIREKMNKKGPCNDSI